MTRVLLALAFLFTGCYRPHPPDGAFRCEADLGNRCPEGLICNGEGLCVHPSPVDMARTGFDLSGNPDIAAGPRSCEERLQQGAFANLVPLSAANSAADEEHLMLDSTGAGRLLFQRGNQLFSAAFDPADRKKVSPPQLVNLIGGPAELHGGTFTDEGKLWIAGTDAGVTSLYPATPSGAAAFLVGAAQAPSSTTCAFSDPFFFDGNPAYQLYVSYALAGCGGASYVVRGLAGRNLGAFYSALIDPGWAAPSLTADGLGLIVRSTVGAPRLYIATRTDLEFQFTTAAPIPMTAIGAADEDRQLLVSGDCRVAYFSSVRAGGAGGADLYATDILPE